MERHEYDLLLGRLAIHFKVMTKDQFGDALQRRRMTAGTQGLEEFLVAEQYLSPEVLAKLERARQQYLQKNGQTPPDDGDQTQPVLAVPEEAPPPQAPVAPQAPAAVDAAAVAQPIAPTVDPLPAEPIVQAVPVEPILEEPVAPALVAPASSGQYLLNYHEGATLEELMTQTRQLNASDLHVHAGAPIRLRLNGLMQDASPALSADHCRKLIFSLFTEPQRETIEDRLQLDFSYEIQGVGRFRANAYKQQRGWDAVFRAIPATPPSLEDLGLPADLERVVNFHQGMVLFTGPAGCGKSSTMAAMVDLLNKSRPDHIITVEDPIEYVHRSQKCLINQREVGAHTESFARALRAALREDPDIIVIGELRDLETIELALTAAETGHLVLGTLHTSNAIRTINRLLGVFPPEQQNQIRTMVSESLRAVVSQRLLPRSDESGRVAAIEVLMTTKAIGNLIREKKTFQILSQMQTGGAQGMVILDNSLADLVKKRVITAEEAQRNAEDPKRFA